MTPRLCCRTPLGDLPLDQETLARELRSNVETAKVSDRTQTETEPWVFRAVGCAPREQGVQPFAHARGRGVRSVAFGFTRSACEAEHSVEMQPLGINLLCLMRWWHQQSDASSRPPHIRRQVGVCSSILGTSQHVQVGYSFWLLQWSKGISYVGF